MVKISTLSLSGFDPSVFFSKLGKSEASASFFTSGQWTVIAWNPSFSYTIDTVSKLREFKLLLSMRSQKRVKGLPFIGGAIGYLNYDLGYELHGIEQTAKDELKFPLGVFHFYDNAVLFDGRSVSVVGDDPSFRRSVEQIHARMMPSLERPNLPWKANITRERFGQDFKKIQRGIHDGEYYQLNYTYSYEATSEMKHRIHFSSLALQNAAASASYFEHGDTAILSLSPERFVQITNGVITTCPIKGTRPRGDTPAADMKLSQELLDSEKEAAELNMITDLLRNDIGKVSKAGSVEVKEHRQLQKNSSVWHTYSVIEGRLDSSISPLDAVLSMFPGGSITGCPKVAAMTEIDRLEKIRRGPYCGSMVMLSDDGSLDSSILIRTIVAKGDRLSLGVGGGIVADSTVSEEWDETKSKVKLFLEPFRRTWIDGREVHSDDSRIAILNPANAKSFGVFETMRVEAGNVIGLKQHLERMENSARIQQMKLPTSIAKIAAYVRLCRDAPARRLYRLKIVCTKANVFIELRPLLIDPALYTGVAATVMPLDRRSPEAKSLPSHLEWTINQAAKQKGFDDAFLVMSDGFIPEAAISNIFWVKRGILHTANERMLPGITRARVLAAAKTLKIPTAFTLATLPELKTADEIFLTRSTVGVVPVVRIDAFTVGAGKVGKITTKLKDALENLR